MKEIIIRYIINHFKVGALDGYIKVIDNYSGKSYSLDSMVSNISTVLDVDENGVYPICLKWLSDKTSEITAVILNNLKNYKVEMTFNDWVVINENGHIIDFKQLYDLLSPLYESKDLLTSICTGWYEEKMFEYLEKKSRF
jgi:hypothetical protein